MTPQPAALEREAATLAKNLPDLIAAAEHAAAAVTAGRHARQRSGQSDSFWQFRDYAPGDPASLIDWRQSARLERRLLVRQTQWEQPQTLLLWCDGDDDFDFAGGKRPTKRFRGQTIALAMAMVLLRSGERVGLWGAEEPARTGTQAIPRLAYRLCQKQRPLQELQPRSGAHVLLISDFHRPPEELQAAFQRVREHRGRPMAVVVEDPLESAFPYQGATRFEGPGGVMRKRFGDALAVREAYHDQRQAHHDALSYAVQRPQESVTFHSTDQSPAPLLLSLLERMNREV